MEGGTDGHRTESSRERERRKTAVLFLPESERGTGKETTRGTGGGIERRQAELIPSPCWGHFTSV
jgi:hypothetical protein